ncbi:uncharacterized protein SAPINGB_P004915 [Magnusiomyces paraingens]|uniref:NADH-cytochrome b5 reductase n=1 Tax=Magnusiomyces paraingens TaxID=2606893 RepID=A0A5E8C048_9ASCO|nr:uncharacterized protein SAPINGB_P004915 [Saprochaete ingens]VVT56250.1 unnamed protein product [Saprochaete ingens]
MIGSKTIITVGTISIIGGYLISKRCGSSNVAFNFPPYRMTPVELDEATKLTPDVKHYRFKLPSSDSPTVPITAPMLIKTSAGIRPFTPFYNDSDPGYIHFAIKNYNRGVSKSVSELLPGDKVKIAGPLPHVQMDGTTSKYDQVYLIGAGSGLTPLWSYLNATLNDPFSQTKLKLIYANKTKDDIVFKNEIDKLKTQYPDRFEVVHVLEQSDEVAKYTGRLTSDILKKEVGIPGEKNKVLVCGPPKFIEIVAGSKRRGPPFIQGTFGGALKEIGFLQSQVVKY